MASTGPLSPKYLKMTNRQSFGGGNTENIIDKFTVVILPDHEVKTIQLKHTDPISGLVEKFYTVRKYNLDVIVRDIDNNILSLETTQGSIKHSKIFLDPRNLPNDSIINTSDKKSGSSLKPKSSGRKHRKSELRDEPSIEITYYNSNSKQLLTVKPFQSIKQVLTPIFQQQGGQSLKELIKQSLIYFFDIRRRRLEISTTIKEVYASGCQGKVIYSIVKNKGDELKDYPETWMATQFENSTEVLKKGKLRKKTHMNRMKYRDFYLFRGMLYYYTKTDTTKLKGVINLGYYNKIEKAHENTAFILTSNSSPTEKSHYFQSYNNEDTEEWIHAINKAILSVYKPKHLVYIFDSQFADDYNFSISSDDEVKDNDSMDDSRKNSNPRDMAIIHSDDTHPSPPISPTELFKNRNSVSATFIPKNPKRSSNFFMTHHTTSNTPPSTPSSNTPPTTPTTDGPDLDSQFLTIQNRPRREKEKSLKRIYANPKLGSRKPEGEKLVMGGGGGGGSGGGSDPEIKEGNKDMANLPPGYLPPYTPNTPDQIESPVNSPRGEKNGLGEMELLPGYVELYDYY